ncbi:MAG: RNA polymerase sigma factor [Actinomycetales bacterium]
MFLERSTARAHDRLNELPRLGVETAASGSESTVTLVEQLLRDEWGRLLALLVARFRRVDLAEDGLADAFEAAVRTWPEQGVPSSPAAWLLTAAKRKILDRLRSEDVLTRRMPLLIIDAEIAQASQQALEHPSDELRDERLRLITLCMHPRLSREASAALTLRLVLGVSTQDLASLFLVPTPTMAARLTRARRKLAGAHFEMPSQSELPSRVPALADIAYLAFTSGYAPASGDAVLRARISGEAIRLVRVIRSLLPDVAPDLDALLALMLFQHSRRDARVRDGVLVLLPDQDRSQWRHEEITEALAILVRLRDAAPSSFLLQALIAAEHAIAPVSDATNWHRIVRHYDELLTLSDSPVIRLNRAIAVAEADGPIKGLEALDRFSFTGHRLPATRAEFLARSGQTTKAIQTMDAAIALCRNDSERTHLETRRALWRDDLGCR